MENFPKRGRGRPRKGAARRARTVDLPIYVDQAVVDFANQLGIPLTDAIALLVARGAGLDDPSYIRTKKDNHLRQGGLKMGA